MAFVLYRFRDFRLDPATRELTRGDALQALPGSAFDCLLYLIEHRERAVGRDELIAAVWGRTDVTDNLLAQTVLRIRRTLGDGGSEGAIRTVARFGYRWVEATEVERIPSAGLVASVDARADARASADALPTQDETLQPAQPRPRRRLAYVLLAVMVLGAMALVPLVAHHWWSTDASKAPDIADIDMATTFVWPAQIPDAEGWEWLRYGLMDLVGNRLRDGGMPVSPSERTLAILSDQSPTRYSSPGAAHVQVNARFERDRWRVRLDVTRNFEPTFEVEAEAADVLDAARSAADLVLVRLGHVPPAGTSRPLALDALLQQTRAALISDQIDLARQLIAQAPPALQSTPEVGLRLAQIDQGLGNDADAEPRLLALLDRVSADSDAALRGRILLALGSSQYRRGALDDARSSFDDAIATLAPTNDAIARAAAYGSRAAIASMREDYAAAETDLGRARSEMQAGGDPLGLAQIDVSLGLTHVRSGRPALGVPLLREAETRIAALGAREELAYVRSVLSGAELQLLDTAAARATSDRAWPPERHTANQRLRWRLTLARIFVLLTQGHFTDVDALLARIATDASPDADADVRDAAAALSGIVLAERGRHEDAIPVLQRAMTAHLAETQPDVHLLAWTWRLRCQRALGLLADAGADTVALQAWVATDATEWRRLHAALAAAEQTWSEADTAAALARFAAAFEQARALGIPDDIAAVAQPYVRALLDAADVDAANIDTAAGVVGLVSAWADEDPRVAWSQAALLRAQGRIDAWREASDLARRLDGERPPPPVRLD